MITYWFKQQHLIFITLFIMTLAGCAPITHSPIPENFTLPQPRQAPIKTVQESLNKFESQVETSDQYLLGAGDKLMVEVWGYPELSGQHIIGPDGRITLPLYGSFSVEELSRREAASIVKANLARFYQDLNITVRVDEYAANRILVLGHVSKPGEVRFGMTNPTLLEAIALAGGLKTGQNLSLSRCAVFRGRDQIVWIDLEPLLLGKDLDLNIRLKRNDVVYVPVSEERLIYVLGEVSHPGAFPLTAHMSFLEALSKAGGPTRDAAANRINLIRPQENMNQEVILDELLDGNQNINVALQEGDIIYVPTNTIAKINYAMEILNPFSSILGIYANIESIRSDRQRRSLDLERENIESQKAALEREQESTAGYD